MTGKLFGLKSKIYAFTYVNELLNEDKSKLIRYKGTTRATIRVEIHFDSLTNTLKKVHLLKMIIIVLDQRNINLVYIK